MSKRKNVNDDEETIEPKRIADDSQVEAVFTSTDFTQMINDPKLCIKGLQKFCQCAKQWTITKPAYDILKSYISLSPDCTEIFKCLETKELSPVDVSTIYETFVKILLRTADDLSESFSVVGVTICRRFLQGHLFKLYGALNTKKPPRVIVSALRLLTAMVMQGRACAADVAMQVDLCGNTFEILSTYKQDERHIRVSNVRLCYIRFVLAFFMTGDLRTIQHVLDAPGFVDSVFDRFSTDNASHIHLFLTTLLEKVVKQTYIPKTNKVRLLGRRGVLLAVAKLFEWDGVMDINAHEESSNNDTTIIHELAYNFLYHACCPFKYGINFFDPEFGTGSRSGNYNLLKFLIDLDKMASNNARARTLVVEIFKSCPDLLNSYFTATNISFEPRISEQWFTNCRLVEEIYISQPALPPALKFATKHRQTTTPGFNPPKLVAMTLPGILPAVFDRPTLKAMITHFEAVVQGEALVFVSAALRRLKTSLDFINDASNWSNTPYSDETRKIVGKQLQEGVKKHIPNITDIVSVWESTHKHREGGDMEIKLLDVLSLYQQTLPDAFGASSYDFSHLLAGMMGNVKTDSRKKCFSYLINILLPSVAKYKWFKQQGEDKQTPFYQLMRIILDFMHEGKDPAVIDSAINLVLKIANFYSVVENKKYNSELLTWIQHLYLACKSSDDEDGRTFLLKYFEKSVFRIAKTPQRYSDKLAKLLETFEGNTNPGTSVSPSVDVKWYKRFPTFTIERSTEDQLPDPQHPAFDESSQENNISLLLVSSFEYIAMLHVDNCPKGHVDLIDSYCSSVLKDLLHLQGYSTKLLQFVFVVTSLSSEILDPTAFPRLTKLREEFSVLNQSCLPRSDCTQPMDVDNVSPSKKSSRKNKTKHSAQKLLSDARDKALIQSMNNLNSDHDRNSTVCDTCFQSVHVESKVAEMLFFLKSAVHSLRSESVNSDDFMNTCRRLCDVLQRYISNIARVDYVELDNKDLESTAKKSEFEDDSAENDSQPESGDSLRSKELMIAVDEKEQDSHFVMKNDDFVELTARILNAQILIDIFVNCAEEYQSCSDVIAISSDLISDLLSFCLSKCPKNSIFNVYKQKITLAMVDFVLGNQDNPNTDQQASIYNCFSKVVCNLDQGHLLKILDAASLQATANIANSFAIPSINSCLDVLLMAANFKGTSLSMTTLKNLFDILTHSKPEGDDLVSFLSLILKLLKAFPSVALFAPSALVTWCVKRCETERVVDLLKVIVTQNFTLQKEVMKLWTGDKYDLSKQSDSRKRCLLPAISSILHHPLKAQHHSIKDDFVLKVKSAFSKLLISDLLESSEYSSSSIVDVIQWLLLHEILSKIHFKKLCSELPKLLEDAVMFEERWEVAMTCIEVSRSMQSEDKTKLFSLQLTESLLTFSCKSLKRDENSLLSSTSGKLFTMLDRLHQLSWTFLKANCNFKTWNRFIKQALKYQFFNASTLEVVIKIVQLMYSAQSVPEELVGSAQLRKMIISHSAFLQGMMSDDKAAQTNKTALVKLLYELTCRCAKDDLLSSDYIFLLGAYGGTLSVCDQYLFQIMLLYEYMAISPEEYKPFLWGSVALNAYPSYKEQAETLYHRPPPSRVLACVDKAIMTSTLTHFPIRRRITVLEDFRDTDLKKLVPFSDPVRTWTSGDAAGQCYDPAFILGVISHLLAPENLVDCRVFLDQNILPFLFMCLSSHCSNVRHLAADCLAAFYEHAQPSKFSEKDLTLYLLRVVMNAVKLGPENSLRKQTSIISVFLSQAMQYMMQPSEHIFVVVQRFLLVKPELDMKDIPEFYHTFFSSGMDYKAERAWILDLICLGMEDTNDFHVAERRQLYRILMCFFDSPLSDNSSRRKVLQIIEKTCSIRGAAFTLISNQALLPWLLNTTILQRHKSLSHDSGLDILKRQDSTLQICGIVKRMWQSLAPPTLEPTNKKVVDRRCNQSEDVPAKEDEKAEPVAKRENSIESGSNVKTKMPVLKRDRAELSVRMYSQLITICFDLLVNLLGICGADKVAQLEDALPGSETLDAFVDTLKCLNEIFKHANVAKGNAPTASSGESRHEKRIFLLTSLPSHQTVIVRKASIVSASGSPVSLDYALEIMTNWIPKINEKIDSCLVLDNLAWGMDVINRVKGQSSNSDVDMRSVLMWMKSWLESLPKLCAETTRLKRGLTQCYEIVCQGSETQDRSGSLPVLHELSLLVVNDDENLKQPQPTENLEEIHKIRQRLYCSS